MLKVLLVIDCLRAHSSICNPFLGEKLIEHGFVEQKVGLAVLTQIGQRKTSEISFQIKYSSASRTILAVEIVKCITSYIPASIVYPDRH